MHDLGWAAALMFTAAAFGLASVAGLIICEHFSTIKREIRMIRRVRRKRVSAMHFLRSTANRDCYSEFDGARRG